MPTASTFLSAEELSKQVRTSPCLKITASTTRCGASKSENGMCLIPK